MSTKIKAFLTIIIILLVAACSTQEPPPKEKPLSQWSEEQLLSKGQTEFEKKNHSNSIRYIQEAAKRDNKEALYALGYMYYYGYGVNKNLDISQDLIRRSASLGHKPAIRALRLFLSKKSIFSADAESARYLSTNPTNFGSKTEQITPPAAIAVNKGKNNINNNQPKLTTNIKPKNEAKKTITKKKLAPKIIKSASKHKTPEVKRSEKIASVDKAKKVELSANNANTVEKTIINKHTVDSNKITSSTKEKHNISIKTKIAKKEKKATSPTANIKTVKQLRTKPIIRHSTKQAKKIVAVKQPQAVSKPTKTETKIEPVAQIQSKKEPINNINNPIGNKWLKKQNPSHYTIQITARKTPEEIEEFIVSNNLQERAKPFSYLYRNKTWYGASFGVYKKPSEAYQAMLNDISPELKARKPWVRQFKNIQLTKKG